MEGRVRHYGQFYGRVPDRPADARPLLVVYGNCQAESLRVLLDSPDAPWRTVRIPPVFELTADDLPHLRRVVAQTSILVAQPVRDGYRDLPLGTDEVLALQPSVRDVRVPVIRHAALFPYQVIVRTPAGDPPAVPYHDLRTLVEAYDGSVTSMDADGIRAVAAASDAELRRREDESETVQVSDLLTEHGADAAHTINHPGNPVLIGLATRVRARLGWHEPASDPGRVLLASVVAPLEAHVLDALGLDGTARPDWTVDGAQVTDAHIRRTQLSWYAQHPEVVTAGLDRHAEVIATLAVRPTT